MLITICRNCELNYVDYGYFLVNDNLEPGAERQIQVFVVPNAAVHYNWRNIKLFVLLMLSIKRFIEHDS